jgi:hypothetical protein
MSIFFIHLFIAQNP